MTSYLLIAAAAAASIATPVLADMKASDAAPVAATTSGTARTAARDQRYCVVQSLTGSRIRHKTCQTRAEWLREDFDPLVK